MVRGPRPLPTPPCMLIPSPPLWVVGVGWGGGEAWSIGLTIAIHIKNIEIVICIKNNYSRGEGDQHAWGGGVGPRAPQQI